MKKPFTLLALLGAALLFVGCGVLDDGPRKVIVTENVCFDVSFLRLNLGQETEIVVDNSQHSDDQESLTLVLREFPVRVTGELPPNSQVGATFTTLRLSTQAGEETSVRVRPIFTGQFQGVCNINVKRDGGGTLIQQGLTFQIVDN
jgi:hypothetical protein